MKLNIRNQTCHLLAEKAVFWEEKKTVIIADIHIGKGTVFRKAGIPIPQGIMDDDLLNITRVFNHLNAEKCIIVGDLIHAESGISSDVKKKFADWLQSTQCEIHLVLGNHDHTLIKNCLQNGLYIFIRKVYLLNLFTFLIILCAMISGSCGQDICILK